MREKLIELLEDTRNNAAWHHWGYEESADHLIANGVRLDEKQATSDETSKWIPVTERLPDNICPVLVALEGLNIAFHGWYQDGKWWKVDAGSRPFAQKVTHWMPLPEPPKGE